MAFDRKYDNRSRKPGAPRREERPRHPSEDRPRGYREDRPQFRQDERPRPRREDRRPSADTQAPVRRSYQDFEYRGRPAESVPERLPREEASPQENLLAGRNPIREALKAGRDIEKLLVQRGELSGSAKEIIQMARERHIIVQEVDKSRLDELSPHHQGMLAFASAYRYSTVEEMLDLAKERGEAPFLIMLDGVTDPHNLGAVIRTAECAGAHGVIIPERRSVGLTPAAVKASAGAVEHLKVAKVTNLTRTMDQLKKAGIWAYAVTMGGQDYRKVRFDGGVLLVIGSEGEGISRLVLEHCDQQVSLPMKGQLDSLNASVAAGIMMYQVMAGRQK